MNDTPLQGATADEMRPLFRHNKVSLPRFAHFKVTVVNIPTWKTNLLIGAVYPLPSPLILLPNS
jgi:hypothetical protein